TREIRKRDGGVHPRMRSPDDIAPSFSRRRVRHARAQSMAAISGAADQADGVVHRRGLLVDQAVAFTALRLSARCALRRLCHERAAARRYRTLRRDAPSLHWARAAEWKQRHLPEHERTVRMAPLSLIGHAQSEHATAQVGLFRSLPR